MRDCSDMSTKIPLFTHILNSKGIIPHAQSSISSKTHTASIFLLPLNHYLVSGNTWWNYVKYSESTSFLKSVDRCARQVLLLWLQYMTIHLLCAFHCQIFLRIFSLGDFCGYRWSFWLLVHHICCAQTVIYCPLYDFKEMQADTMHIL